MRCSASISGTLAVRGAETSGAPCRAATRVFIARCSCICTPRPRVFIDDEHGIYRVRPRVFIGDEHGIYRVRPRVFIDDEHGIYRLRPRVFIGDEHGIYRRGRTAAKTTTHSRGQRALKKVMVILIAACLNDYDNGSPQPVTPNCNSPNNWL